MIRASVFHFSLVMVKYMKKTNGICNPEDNRDEKVGHFAEFDIIGWSGDYKNAIGTNCNYYLYFMKTKESYKKLIV